MEAFPEATSGHFEPSDAPDSSTRQHIERVGHGLILVTGPTGSGKTTTLYSALNELNSPMFNIVTVEDPVEFQIPGINQVRLRRKSG